MFEKLKLYWTLIQDLLTVKAGLYIDAMCVAIIVRILAVLFHFPPLTGAEAGLWGVTLTAFSGHHIAKILKGNGNGTN